MARVSAQNGNNLTFVGLGAELEYLEFPLTLSNISCLKMILEQLSL